MNIGQRFVGEWVGKWVGLYRGGRTDMAKGPSLNHFDGQRSGPVLSIQ